MHNNLDLYRTLYRIRRFEETVLENFPRGLFFGTTHTYMGQEANAAGVLASLSPQDIVFSSHRCHGHFLASGGDMQSLFAELMGRQGGVCAGRGGSQHLHWGSFYSNGIQGGIVPVATGMALAEKYKKSGVITAAFLGDGTLGQGVVYESLNMASLWGAPVLYVVENNRIAQTTPSELAVAGDICARFSAFGIPAARLETSDVLEILPLAARMVEAIRKEASPRALVLDTHRFGPHSKGDDTRPVEEVAQLKEVYDPIRIHGARLNPDQRQALEAEVEAEVRKAFQAAFEQPLAVSERL
jgi:acetoin:2,6-dichlorophenolindophenol oxidoreductase subunit alpha